MRINCFLGRLTVLLLSILREIVFIEPWHILLQTGSRIFQNVCRLHDSDRAGSHAVRDDKTKQKSVMLAPTSLKGLLGCLKCLWIIAMDSLADSSPHNIECRCRADSSSRASFSSMPFG